MTLKSIHNITHLYTYPRNKCVHYCIKLSCSVITSFIALWTHYILLYGLLFPLLNETAETVEPDKFLQEGKR